VFAGPANDVSASFSCPFLGRGASGVFSPRYNKVSSYSSSSSS